MDNLVLSVCELNTLVKNKLESDPFLKEVSVFGEISNYKLYPSGHHYFSLKDDEASISCVLFKGNAYGLRFKIENGMSVVIVGHVSVYPRDGKYQLYCEHVLPAGAGELQIAYEQLKAKLDAQGLFDSSHKKKLPEFPERICIITSRAGAAVHDIIRILNKRWPLCSINLIPVKVQGEGAAEEIAAAIEYANKQNAGDIIIVGRGGGSIEDLWAFNEEIVAKAIYNSEIPVISAVGHEPDTTISDYVSDVRASTPSNAAEIAVPNIEDVINRINSYSNIVNPSAFINNARLDLDRYRDRLEYLEQRIISQKKEAFLKASSSLDAMSPLKVLKRGYSVVYSEGELVTDSAKLSSGDKLNIKLDKGEVLCTVDKVKNEL